MGIELRVRDGSLQEYGCVFLPAAFLRKMSIEKGGQQAIAAKCACADTSEGADDTCLALVASICTSTVTADRNWTGQLARLHTQIERVR